MDAMRRRSTAGNRALQSIAGRVVVAFVGAVFLVAVGSARAASTVPFSDTFSYPDGISLDGTNGWGAAGAGSAGPGPIGLRTDADQRSRFRHGSIAARASQSSAAFFKNSLSDCIRLNIF